MWRRSPKTQNTVTQKDIGFVREKLEARLSWKKSAEHGDTDSQIRCDA